MSFTKFLKLLNWQTFTVLLVSMVSCYVAVLFEIDANYDLLLLNLATSLLEAFSEGASLAVVFLAVQVLSRTGGGS